MIDDEDELIKQAVLRRLEHLEPLPIDDADYDKEFPLTDAPHTCSRCGATYDVGQFMALALPDDGKGIWTYPTHAVQIAVRKCGTPGCKNMLGRRIA